MNFDFEKFVIQTNVSFTSQNAEFQSIGLLNINFSTSGGFVFMNQTLCTSHHDKQSCPEIFKSDDKKNTCK